MRTAQVLVNHDGAEVAMTLPVPDDFGTRSVAHMASTQHHVDSPGPIAGIYVRGREIRFTANSAPPAPAG